MDRETRAIRLRPAVLDAVRGSSLRKVATAIRVSHGTLHNFLYKGEVPFDSTLAKIEEWAREQPATGSTPAEQIIHLFGHDAGLRSLGHVADEDLIRAAYAIALADKLPQEEMAKLDAWRDRLLASKTNHAE